VDRDHDQTEPPGGTRVSANGVPLSAVLVLALLVVAFVALLVVGLPDKWTKPAAIEQPRQLPLHGGPLTAGKLDSSCYGTDATLCGGNTLSVLGVDTRRSRFLVVWSGSLTRFEDGAEQLDKVMARFVSPTGRIGHAVALSEDAGFNTLLSVRYEPRTDRFVVGWNHADHYLSAATLAVVAPRRRSHWTADNISAARDPNVRIWGHERGQRGRIPKSGLGLAIWDTTDDTTNQIDGQILPPGVTCQGSRRCEPLGPASMR